jgi:hypothetical protein
MSNPRRKRALALLALLAVPAVGLKAQSTLLYLELQMVAAYATDPGEIQLYSLMPGDAMQKPSLGFDAVRRFSGRSRDIGVLAVQARLAYDRQREHKIEPQLYNAYFRLKTKPLDVWVGHNRPALGLAPVLDSHALLLPAPPMLGFGFDRDWGVGVARDTDWGGWAASMTAGSGMSLRFRGNYLAAARVFKGVPARDNYSLGLSLAHGDVLETMGHEPDPAPADPVDWTAAGLDATYFWRNFEHRAEVLVGQRDGALMALVFWRAGLALLEEGRLKLEAQPALWRKAGSWDYALGAGLTYLFNADLAGRFMVFHAGERRGARFVFQLYYYKGL